MLNFEVRWSCLWMFPSEFWTHPKKNIPQPLLDLCKCLLIHRTIFFIPHMTFIYCILSFCSEKSLTLSSLQPCNRSWKTEIMSLLRLFLLRLSKPIHLPLVCMLCAPAPWVGCWPLLNSLWYVHGSLSLGIPKPDTVIQMWSHKCQTEEKDLFTDLLATTSQCVAGLLGQKTHTADSCSTSCHKESTDR